VRGRRTNLALLVALAVATVTGVAAFSVGTGWARWLVVAHGSAGIAVIVLAPWKSTIARRGITRRGLLRALPALTLAVLALVTVGSGLVHAAGIRHVGAITTMQIHVGAAIAAVALTCWHVATRPVRARRDDVSRRELLRLGGLGVGASTAYVVTELVVGIDRRFTGSHEVGSHDPTAMPVTQWFDDDVPQIDRVSWRLDVAGRPWTWDELAAQADAMTAVLDCTGGWWAEQTWTGARLDRLLAASGAGDGASVVVRSATGYERRLPMGDTDRLLVATHVAGAPLSRGHGAPARLVAPGRRGFWWVKWVVEIRVSDRPGWAQFPFPLT
jgi:hypothetical protein